MQCKNTSTGGEIYTPCNFSTFFSPRLWFSWELVAPYNLHCFDSLLHIIYSCFYIKND